MTSAQENLARVLKIIRSEPHGCTFERISQQVPDLDAKNFADIVNALLSQILIEMTTSAEGHVIYMALDEHETRILKLLEHDEKLVYEHIKAADVGGIWMKDLIHNTGLHRQVLNKTIKCLESKNIIKSVKSIKNPSKKIFMLSHLTPSVEITGGAWFTDQELDVEFVETLARTSMKFIASKATPKQKDAIFSVNYNGYPSADDVRQFISNSKLTPVELATSDVEDLLQMLVYDGQLERIQHVHARLGKTNWVYRPSAIYLNSQTNNGRSFTDLENPPQGKLDLWTEVPCSVCPVFEQCSDHGRVTPQNCVYFDDWLAR